jgi:cytochrome b subunit of formate dehydrogenase
MNRIPPPFGRTVPMFALALAATLALAAARGEAIPNGDCFDCHSDKELMGTNQAGRTVSMYVDKAAYAASVHADQACTDCHDDIKELEHPPVLKPVDCSDCHDEETKDYRESLHGLAARTGVVEAASCADCHGSPHYALASDNTNSPAHFANVPHTCAACHGDLEKMRKFGLRKDTAVVSYENSAHGKALGTQTNGKHAAVCTDCHGSHRLLAATDVRSELHWQNIPKTCGKCHEEVADRFHVSVHGLAAAKGDRDAPVCTDCHGEHDIASARDDRSKVSASHIPETCGQCHGAERIATRYAFSSSVVDTYEQSFHGLASKLGGVAAANCASCHGVHDILPSSDPRSAVHPDNLPKTCGECHPGIGTRLAAGPMQIHLPPGAAEGKHPAVNLVSRAYFWMIVFVIGGMFVYNFIDYAARVREQIRRVKADPYAEVRMTPILRAQHFSMIILFFTLAYTGFVHKYPEAAWSWPFRAIENGSHLRGELHRIAGWAFTALFAVHLVLLVATRRGHAYLVHLALKPHDAADALNRLQRNLGARKPAEPYRRFTFAEKAEYWALVWGSVVMIVTGIVLIYSENVLSLWPKVWLELSQVIHYYEAVLATLAIVVWHLYWVIFEKSEYPMNTAWLIGRKPGHGERKTEDEGRTTDHG